MCLYMCIHTSLHVSMYNIDGTVFCHTVRLCLCKRLMLYIIHMYINSVCTFHVCEHMQLHVTASIPLLFGGGGIHVCV